MVASRFVKGMLTSVLGVALGLTAFGLAGCDSSRENRDEATREWESDEVEAQSEDLEQRGEAIEERAEETDDAELKARGERMQDEADGLDAEADELDD